MHRADWTNHLDSFVPSAQASLSSIQADGGELFLQKIPNRVLVFAFENSTHSAGLSYQIGSQKPISHLSYIMLKNFAAVFMLMVALCSVKSARADLIFDFALDGTGTVTTTLSSGVKLTTHSIVGQTTIKVSGNSAVDKVGPGNNGNWDDGEAWTFSFDQNVEFSDINFGGFQNNEQFVISSAGFDGLTESVYDAVDGLDYDPAADSFSFTNVNADSNDIYNFEPVTIAAGTQITISYTGQSATLQPSSGTFSAVPEPSSALLLGIAVAGIAARRRRSS